MLPTKKIVLGVGNLLRSDEGLGVHAIRTLRESSDRNPEIEFIDGGTLGLELLPVIEDATYLLIIDAIHADKPAGEIIEFAFEDLNLEAQANLSLHQLRIEDTLRLALIHDRLPQAIWLIGMQPASLDWGTSLSQELADNYPKFINRVLSIIESW